jgi:hypothetical protein
MSLALGIARRLGYYPFLCRTLGDSCKFAIIAC